MTRPNIVLAATVLLAACSQQPGGSTTATTTTVSAHHHYVTPLEAAKEEAQRDLQAMTSQNIAQVHDVPSCLAATVNGKSDFGTWPAKAFAAYLDPKGFHDAMASADGFKETDLETALKPKAEALITELNPKRTPYIVYEVAGDSVQPYGTFWHTHHGFTLRTTIFARTPVYTADGTPAECVVNPPNDQGPNGNFGYVEVSDETTARAISTLVAQHQVHPRFLMKVISWYPAGSDNTQEHSQTSIHITASIVKVQLIGPDG